MLDIARSTWSENREDLLTGESGYCTFENLALMSTSQFPKRLRVSRRHTASIDWKGSMVCRARFNGPTPNAICQQQPTCPTSCGMRISTALNDTRDTPLSKPQSRYVSVGCLNVKLQERKHARLVQSQEEVGRCCEQALSALTISILKKMGESAQNTCSDPQRICMLAARR